MRIDAEHIRTEMGLQSIKQLTEVSPLEHSRRELVKDKLANIQEPFRALVPQVLCYLLKHGEVNEMTMYGDPLFRKQNLISAATSQAVMHGLAVARNNHVQVNPELRDALTFYLLGDGSVPAAR